MDARKEASEYLQGRGPVVITRHVKSCSPAGPNPAGLHCKTCFIILSTERKRLLVQDLLTDPRTLMTTKAQQGVCAVSNPARKIKQPSEDYRITMDMPAGLAPAGQPLETVSCSNENGFHVWRDTFPLNSLTRTQSMLRE